MIDFAQIKEAAVGKCGMIIAALTPLPADVVNKRSADHPCPVCGGNTVIWPDDRDGGANQHGRIACRNCTRDEPTGDIVATIAAFSGISQSAAATRVAEYLGVPIAYGNGKPTNDLDLMTQICRSKQIDIEQFQRFGPVPGKWGDVRGFDIPMLDASGGETGRSFIAPTGDSKLRKGQLRKGAKHGLYVPDGRLPEHGDRVYLVEGFKDAAALNSMGLTAIGLPTCSMKAGFAVAFRGCDVTLVPDLDAVGDRGADTTASRLHGIASRVRIARLPGEKRKSGGDDVRDVLRRSDGEQMVRDAIEDAKDWVPTDAPTGSTWLTDPNLHQHNELAMRFVDQQGENLRFVAKWGKWIVWDGRRWASDDGAKLVLRAVRRFAKSLWKELLTAAKLVDPNELGKIQTFVKRSNNEAQLKAVINLAAADPRVLISHEDLNADRYLINLQNGTFELMTGKCRPHRRSDLITQIANVSHDPAAKCPKWIETLALITDGDQELIDYVQQLLGYSMTGDTGEAILPIVCGEGNNGKSTVWNTIVQLLGDYAHLASESVLLGESREHPTAIAQLYQKRFVPISEPESGTQMRESRVKELTGESVITARRMREDNWSFPRTHTFWMSTNHLPKVKGTDKGIWRRLKVIPFSVDLSERVDPIPDFHKRLIKEEGPGIFNWMVVGWQSYLNAGRKFTEPQCVTQCGTNYREEEDHIGRFLDEACIVGEGSIVAASDLFDAYKKWGGHWTQTAFGKEMATRFDKDKPTSGSFRRKVIYHGVSIEGV